MSNLFHGAAWIDGRIIPIAQAGVPVTDWGLTHSDITYDVVPVWQGAFFRLDDYVARFCASLATLRMEVGLSPGEISEALHDMVATSGLRDAYVAMVATRGLNPIPASRDPRDCINRFYAWCVPYVHILKPEISERGAHVWIGKSVRRIPRDSVDPRVKNYHWGDFTSALFEAKDRDYDTAVLLDHKGNVTEGPGFNLFALFGDRLVTPDHGVLHGITRKTVLEMATARGLQIETRPLPLEECLQADEVFLSSSGGGVLPVARLDEHYFSNGAPGLLARQLRADYFELLSGSQHRVPISY